MKNHSPIPYETSTRVTLWANRLVIALVLLLLPSFPWLTEQYHLHFRELAVSERTAILVGFYTCAVAVLLALWNMERLLKNILRAILFTLENVQHIRTVRWCCLAVSLICFGAAFGFPSLLFFATVMGFLCLVITVVGQVMKAAVEIREENDLTI